MNALSKERKRLRREKYIITCSEMFNSLKGRCSATKKEDAMVS